MKPAEAVRRVGDEQLALGVVEQAQSLAHLPLGGRVPELGAEVGERGCVVRARAADAVAPLLHGGSLSRPVGRSPGGRGAALALAAHS